MKRFKATTLTEEELGINPTITPLKIPVRSITLYGGTEYDENGNPIGVNTLIESTPYTKIFSTSAHRKHIAKLSPNSTQLLMWILLDIKPSKHFININKDRYMEETGCARSSYYKSIKELHKAAIIVPTTEKNVYWINPEFFFKGNRIRKYPDKIIKQ